MGHTLIVTFLLENGAKTETATMRGETALHLAARANQTEIMRILLRQGANVDAKAKVRLYLFIYLFIY
jgi:ankyrin